MLPTAEELALLQACSGTAAVYGGKDVFNGDMSSLKVKCSNNSILMGVDYDDIVFKFECLAIRVSKNDVADITQDTTVHPEPLVILSNWHRLKLCFCYEWEVPLLPSEMVPGKGKVRGDYGKKADIAANATAMCVSLHGIVFWNDESNEPVAAIVKPPENTVLMRLYEMRTDIKSFMSRCDVFDLEDVQNLIESGQIGFDR